MNLINQQEISQISFELYQIAIALQKLSEQQNGIDWFKIFSFLVSLISPIFSVYFGYKIAIWMEDRKAGRAVLQGMVAALSDLERYINRFQNELYGISYLISQAGENLEENQLNINQPWREVAQRLSEIQLRASMVINATGLEQHHVFILRQLQQKIHPLITDVDYFNKGFQQMDHRMLEYYHFLPPDIRVAYDSFSNDLAALSRTAYLDFQSSAITARIREIINLAVLKTGIRF